MELTNPATERALLGCILFDNRLLDEINVSASLFADNLNREIWVEIEKARARGSRADLQELYLRMPDKAVYLAELTSLSSVNGPQYFEDLRELAKKRAFFDMAKGVAARLKDEYQSGQIADYCEKSLTEISEQTESGYKHVSAIIPGVIDDIEKAINLKGALSGIPTGIPKLDFLLNGMQPEYWIIGARPAVGKTAFLLSLASSAMRSKKPRTNDFFKVGLFSCEMGDRSLVKREIADYASVDQNNIRSGFFYDGEIERIHDAMAQLVEQGLYICDTPNIRKAELISQARKMKRKEHVDFIGIDYLTLISSENQDIPRHEQVADISRSMKALSRELEIPVVALSQIKREADGKRPVLGDLRESGSIEQDADGVIFLWDNGPDDDAGKVQRVTGIVAKQRNGELGDFPMLFYKSKMRFRQAEVDKW